MELYSYPGLVPEERIRVLKSRSAVCTTLTCNPGLLFALTMAFLLIFLFCGPLLRLIDPVAAVVDVGALSLLLLSLLAGLCFVAVSHWLLGLLWPVFRAFGRHHFVPVFKSLLPWQKIVIFLGCYFLLLFAFVACLLALC